MANGADAVPARYGCPGGCSVDIPSGQRRPSPPSGCSPPQGRRPRRPRLPPQRRAAPAPCPAYNLANFLRSLALPREVEQWSLTTFREKLVKIGARIVRHGRYVVFQLAEVAVPRAFFAAIRRRIDRLRGPAMVAA